MPAAEPVPALLVGGEPGEELDAETALDLANLGIVSPVTRDTAGSLYFRELARQVGAAACKERHWCFRHALPPACRRRRPPSGWCSWLLD